MKMQTNPSEARDDQPEVDRLKTVLTRADKGDEIALAEVREMLQAAPSPAIALLGGDLAERAVTLLVGRVAEGQPVFREALLAKLEALRAELSIAESWGGGAFAHGVGKDWGNRSRVAHNTTTG